MAAVLPAIFLSRRLTLVPEATMHEETEDWAEQQVRNRAENVRLVLTPEEEHCNGMFLHTAAFRKRSAFATAETELKLMAAAARIGESSNPKAGYSTPAAIGTPTAL